jgi:hypothetical protein
MNLRRLVLALVLPPMSAALVLQLACGDDN